MEHLITTRRSFLLTTAGVVAGASVSSALFTELAEAQATTTLTVVSYGGIYQEMQTKAYFEPYQKEHPEVTIRQENPTSYAKLRAMADSGSVTWDIALVGPDFGFDADGAWLEPIDYSIIDKGDYLPGYADTYRVGADIEATAMTYRTDVFAKGPSSFADFFDLSKFPGKRAIWKYAPGGVFETALVADGVAPDKLYPLDVDRALRKLDTIKDSIIWWETGAQAQQLLSSGEAHLGLLWLSGGVAVAKNAPAAIAWGQWTTQGAFWVVPKGTKNKDAAMKAVKSFTSPAAQTELSRLLPYSPTNAKAVLPEDALYKDSFPSEHPGGRVAVDSAWWNANQAVVDAKFQDWLLL